MKSVPPHIAELAPEGTLWFGGPVDRSEVALRVAGPSLDRAAISAALGHIADRDGQHWTLHAPESSGGDLDSQVEWLLSRLTQDLTVWEDLAKRFKIDLFCGLFLERSNRGVSLRPDTLGRIAARHIELGFDIYAPDNAKA